MLLPKKYDQSKYSIHIIYYYFSILFSLSISPVKLGEMCFVFFSDPLKSQITFLFFVKKRQPPSNPSSMNWPSSH